MASGSEIMAPDDASIPVVLRKGIRLGPVPDHVDAFQIRQIVETVYKSISLPLDSSICNDATTRLEQRVMTYSPHWSNAREILALTS